MSILTELSYFETLNGISRLLYNETAAKAITELTKPAHRLAVSQGKWPIAGISQAEMLMKFVFHVGLLAQSSDSIKSRDVPALTQEEKKVADLFLELANYCAGRGIDLGNAVVLTHMANAQLRS